MDLRKLDAEIAVRVMGWKQYLTKSGIYYLGSQHAFSPEFMADREIEVVEYCGRDYDNAPHYTTNPVASKALREKLAERFTLVEMAQFNGHAECTVINRRDVTVGLMTGAEEHVIATEQAESLELAIVLCAAKAFGIEVE